MDGLTSDGQGYSIDARDVRPGMVDWNPYGGRRGRVVVASEPRERPDGAVEFDAADGRTGIFRPQFGLHYDRAATERLAAERNTGQPGNPPQRAVTPTKDTNMQTAFTDKATPQEAAQLQDTLERGYKKAYQAAHEAFSREPWGSDYESRFQTAAECNEVAADVVHETLANGIRRPCESTADFLSRTRAEAQAAEPNRSGFETPGRWGDVARLHGLSTDVKTFERDMHLSQFPRDTAELGGSRAALAVQSENRPPQPTTRALFIAARAARAQRIAAERNGPEAVNAVTREHADIAAARVGDLYPRHPDRELQAEPEAG